MTVIYVMLPFALLLGFGFTAAFIWMTAKGQYDDLETPAYRLLIDETELRSVTRFKVEPVAGLEIREKGKNS